MTETTRTWPGALGTLLAASALAVTGGASGLLAGAAVAASWYVLPTPAAFAVGQFALVAVAADAGPLALVVAEGGLLGLLAGSTLDADRSARLVALAVGGVALLAASGWASYRWLGAAPQAAAVLAVGFALGAYGLHRYERVALGLVSPSHDHE